MSRHGENSVEQHVSATDKNTGHQEGDIHPEDSVSQCWSKTSSTSRSVARARVKAAAKKAALEAEQAALQQLQALEVEELRVRQRKTQLAMKTKLAMAEAEEAVYALNDGNEHSAALSAQASDESDVQVSAPPPSTPAVDTSPACQATEMDMAKEPVMKPDTGATEYPDKTPDTDKTVTQVKTTEAAIGSKENNASVLELVYQGQRQQEHLLEVIQLPKAELLTFDGDPLQYWVFIRAFDNSVDKSSLEDSAKLIRLIQYCTGRAKKVIQCCSVMQPSEGYKKAKALLKERFGNNYTIAEAWVNKVTEGSSIGPYDKKALREFADDLKTCRETLSAMGYIQEINTQKVLVTMVEKLPSYLRNRWVKEVRVIRKRKDRLPQIGDLVEFVEDAADEVNDPVYGDLSKPKDRHVTNRSVPKSPVSRYSKGNYTMMTNAKPTGNMTCILCNGSHNLFGCSEFKGKRPEERFEFAKLTRLCYNCLRPGHMSNACTLNRVCSVAGCGRKHTKFLHQIRTIPESLSTQRSEVTTVPAATVQSGYTETEVDMSCNVTGVGTFRVALPIVPVKVKAMDGGICVDTYALLDSGSTSTFCTEELAKQLKLSGEGQLLSLTTLVEENVRTQTTVVSLTVSGIDCGQTVDLPLVYTRQELPIHKANLARQEDIEKWPHLQGIKLPQVDKGRVNLLIGQDVPEALMPLEVRKGGKNAPYATRTELGWSLNGPLGRANKHIAASNFIAADDALESQLKMFWKLDTTESLHDDTKGMSVKDKKAVAIWEEGVRLVNGHYELPIPFKSHPPDLVDNRTIAERRLFSLGKRLQRDTLLHSQYTEGMKDLVSKGYAERVPEEVTPSDRHVWYLPHHPVYHPCKPDKIRIVFDCASSHCGTSLNDQVLSGPDLTNKLLGVLLRFRQETVALMADIQAMFHQVRVFPEDRDVLRYLWWSDGDSSQQPSVYRMTAHPFGGTWSPSCCTFALQRTAEDNRQDFQPDTVDTVMRNFYVDDCLKSVSSEEEGIQLAQELRSLLARGGFRLTKWISSSLQVLASIPVEERAKDVKELDLNYEALPTERALGMQWDVELDCFGYKISPKDKPLTRRGILSVVSSIYDPLGFVNPFTLTAKVIIQDLCRRKLSWDEALPSIHLDSWQQWKQELPMLEQFKVNRSVKPCGLGEVAKYQLHHFSDASEVAYGATTYLRMTNSECQNHCCLLMAKSHLAPIKKMTIPRLELMGATLSVKLEAKIRRESDWPLEESVFWTDSTIVLQYVRNEQRRFHTFVANRVAVIHSESSPSQWHHIESKLNPADDITRGQTAEELLANRRWLNGPDFLCLEESEWPESPSLRDLAEEDPEVKPDKEIVTVCAVNKVEQLNVVDRLLEGHSSWYRLKKSVAWLLRVKNYLRAKAKKQQTMDMQIPMTVDEMTTAEDSIIKYIQKQPFCEELKFLEKEKEAPRKSRDYIKKNSPLYKLNPVLSTDGIIRISGRLKNAPVDERVKRPAILPKNHHVVNLIVRHFHQVSGHSGREHVLSLLRQRYWLIRARPTVRNALRDCFQCKRQSAAPVEQKMADLPSDRVTPDKPPFSFVGVDCFGPFMVKQGRSLVKRYGCIFTCLVVRAVHIEVLHTMEADSFVNALQRFMCRRGQPEEIRSDNGSNFVGAERELREALKSLNQQKIGEFLLQKGIKWKFNPPTASHMGGAWERQIRTTRKLLNSLTKEQTMYDESLSTLMCLVESIINGRPITTVSDDVNDPEPLTPNHLLLLRAGPVMPPGEFDKKDMYGRRRWRQVQYLADVFWRRWIGEYLPTLQERQKWFEPKRNIKVGDLVLVVDGDSPRSRWLMGRVIETYQGGDQLVRSVKVKTRSATLRRPVQKLCLLETVERAESMD